MRNEEKQALKFLSFLPPAIFIPLGVPLALKQIEPNGTYGFRNKDTLQNLEVWYAFNALGGWWMIIAGVLSIGIVFLLHKGSTGSLFKFTLSYTICILLLFIAIFLTYQLS